MKRLCTKRLLQCSAALTGSLLGPLVLSGVTLAPQPAYAQAAGDTQERKVTLNLRDTPLRDALNLLFAGSGLQFSVDPNVQNIPITLNIRDVSLQAALRMVTRQAATVQPGLTFNRDGDVFVIKVRQLTQPTDNQGEPAPPEQELGEQELTWEKIPIQFNDVMVFTIAFGGTMLPTEADIKGGGMMGGMGMGGMGGGMMGGMGGMGMGGMGGGMMGGMGGMGGFGGMGGMGGGMMGGMGGFGGMGGMGGGMMGGGMGGFGGMGGMGGGMMGGMGGFGGGGMGGFGGGGMGGGFNRGF